MEQLREPKTNVFFGPQNQTHRIRSTTLSRPEFFRLFLDNKITNSGTQQREDGSTMRYAKALPRDFRFLPGPHGARRTRASQPMQKQHATRDEGNTTHTLHARRVVCRCHIFLPLAVSISFINSYLPDGDYRPRRGKDCGCATSQLLS